MTNLPPTLGAKAVQWIETFLVFSSGPKLGEQFKLQQWQKLLLYELLEQKEDLSFRYKRALVGASKGSGKTELIAALSLWGLLSGEIKNPNVVIVASSYDQAGLLFKAAGSMVENGPLNPYVDVFEKKIIPKDGNGELTRLAAVAGANDGLKANFAVFDELHEFIGKKERVHLVVSNALAKMGGMEINITTAGSNTETLCGRLYKYGKALEKGEQQDDSFYFKWYEASQELDLDKEEDRRIAVQQANPSVGVTVDLETIVKRYEEIPQAEWKRYFANQWATQDKAWLPVGAWDLCLADKGIPAGAECVATLDGSVSGDSTSLTLVSIEEVPHIVQLGLWERPEWAGPDWRIDRNLVHAAVDEMFQKYDIKSFLCDPPYWWSEIDQWAEKYGEQVVLMFPTSVRKRMVEATGRFFNAVVDKTLTHNGDPDLARHISNAVTKTTLDGSYITKEFRQFKIDAAVSAVMGYYAATTYRENETPTVAPLRIIEI